MISKTAICTALLSLALGVGSAQGAVRPFLPEFPLNGLEGRAALFEDACGVALDSQGDLYVSEYFGHAIDVYDPSIEILLAKITRVDPVDGPCGVAVDSSGHVFVNSYHEGVLELTPSSFPPNEGTTYGSAETLDSAESTGLALDPTTGDLYINDRTYIARYESPLEVGEEPAEKIGLGTLKDGYGLAFSSFAATEGDLYVPDAASNTLKVYDPATSLTDPVEEIDGAGTPQGGFHSLVDSAVAVDPTNGHIFVADNTQPGFEAPAAVIDEFNAAGEYRGQLPHAIVDAEPPGIAVDGSSGNVYVTSGNGEGSALYAFGPPAAAHRLEVAKTGSGGGRLESQPAGISCGTACAAEYDSGATVTLTASPDAHSAFAGFSGCATQSGTHCTVTMGSDKTVQAEFEALPQQSLSVTSSGPGTVQSSPEGIECPGECTAPFNEGGKVLLQAQHDERTAFAGFTGCDAQPAPGRCEVTMSAAKAIQASFTPIPQRTLTVTRTGAGKGALTGTSPGPEFTPIACGATCTAEYDQGAQITLSVAANPGSRFAGFSGCDSQPAPGQCAVTMSAAKSVSADFEPIPSFSLSVTAQGSGQGLITSSPAGISCPLSCTAQYVEGETIVLSANPAPGSSFAGWSGACSGTGTCRVVIGADTALSAAFQREALPSAPKPPDALVLGQASSASDGRSVTLQVTVPAPGTLSAKAPYIIPAEAKLKAPGTTTLKLALSAKGKQALQQARRHRLTVKVSVAFTPAATKSALIASKVIVFQRAPRKQGGATLKEKGELFVSFNGALFPRTLPRHRLAPVTVAIAGKVRTPPGEGEPAVRHIEIAVNRHGVLDTTGLPLCQRKAIAFATTAQALEACKSALIGEGSFAAHIHLGSQVSFPSQGHILAFNSKRDGHSVILAHIYGTQPVPITHILVFAIDHTKGTYATVLSTTLAKSAANRAQVRYISLVLHRTYTYRGKTHSYLSADCPAPPGISAAPFPLAHSSMSFTDGSTLQATIMRSCEASR